MAYWQFFGHTLSYLIYLFVLGADKTSKSEDAPFVTNRSVDK